MKLSSLSPTDLAQSLADTHSQSLLYVLRFANGFQPSAVTARYNPSSTPQWTFKYNDYDTLMAECNAAPSASSDKCLAFGVKGTTLQGSTDVAGGTITMRVPPSCRRGPLLTALAGGQCGQLRRCDGGRGVDVELREPLQAREVCFGDASGPAPVGSFVDFGAEYFGEEPEVGLPFPHRDLGQPGGFVADGGQVQFTGRSADGSLGGGVGSGAHVALLFALPVSSSS